MSFDSPGPIMHRLAQIATDLEERQNDYEQAAETRARLTRDWEKRLAAHRITAKGQDADTRKAAALAAAIEQDDLYERLMKAEGAYEGCKAVIKVLEIRVGIGQSLLKAMGRA